MPNTRRKMKYRKKGTRQKYKQGAGGGNTHSRKQSIQSTRAACDENPICHTEHRSFIGYESFRRPSAPQAKVNIHRGERATRHRAAKN